MALLASNFTSNSLSGQVRVSAGRANVNLVVAPYAFEGNKTFTIKLRKNGIGGEVLKVSDPITIYDYTGIASLTPNVVSVNEGNLVQFSLATTNVVNGTVVYYSVLPVTANVTLQDFFGSNVGSAVVTDNVAVISLYANVDQGYVNEDGETFKLQIRTNSTSGNVVYTSANVSIVDFYKLFGVTGFTESAASITEGSTFSFTFNGLNIPTGTTLYYSTEGNATSASFTSGNTGSFVMNSTSNVISLTTTPTVFSGETRNFSLKIRSGSATGPVVATSNTVAIVDTALGIINATGGTIIPSDGYKTHVFTSSDTFVVTNAGSGQSSIIDYLIVGGGGAGGSGGMPSYTGGGGGGAGGLLLGNVQINTGNTVITVGAGAGVTSPSSVGGTGGNTTVVFSAGSTLIAYGGGGGAGGNLSGTSGGSGGGGGSNSTPASGGTGAPGQGNPGGTNSTTTYGGVPNSAMGGGGGGAGEQGHWKSGDPSSAPTSTQAGGNGIAVPWAPPAYGTSGPTPGQWFAGGGGGGGSPAGSAYIMSGGAGGGGAGGFASPGYPTSAIGSGAVSTPDSGANATINTGGGGGGIGNAGLSSGTGKAGKGGSGIVIIRYPWTPPAGYVSITANSSIASEGGNVFFVVNTTYANALTLYYDTIGNVTSASFTTGNTGSFVVTGNTTVLRLETTSTVPTNEERFFALRVREDSATSGSIKLVSSNVYIYDSAISTFISATGGNVTTVGSYKIHTFTTSGVLNINSKGVGSQSLDVLIVGGGGAGGYPYGGGGGGGGVLAGPLTAVVGNVTTTVGGGGSFNVPVGAPSAIGSNSTILFDGTTYIALGGGAGGSAWYNATPGGSGGGGGAQAPSSGGGSKTQNPQGPLTGYGNNGGAAYVGSPGSTSRGGAGGGAGGGGNGGGGAGGVGIINTITGSTVGEPSGGSYYIAGGGGGSISGAGGLGGGSPAGNTPPNRYGTTNTGGGGGAGWDNDFNNLYAGGSGVVVFRYQYV